MTASERAGAPAADVTVDTREGDLADGGGVGDARFGNGAREVSLDARLGDRARDRRVDREDDDDLVEGGASGSTINVSRRGGGVAGGSSLLLKRWKSGKGRSHGMLEALREPEPCEESESGAGGKSEVAAGALEAGGRLKGWREESEGGSCGRGHRVRPGVGTGLTSSWLLSISIFRLAMGFGLFALDSVLWPGGGGGSQSADSARSCCLCNCGLSNVLLGSRYSSRGSGRGFAFSSSFSRASHEKRRNLSRN